MANATTTLDESHEKCRNRVCVVCYKKAATNKSTARSLSAIEIATIQDYIIDGYEVTNSDFPCGVCVDCHLLLTKKHKDPEFQLPSREINYEPNRPTSLRSIQVCTCCICEIAYSNGLKFKLNKPKRGRPTTNSTPVQNYKVCSRCFAPIYRGSNHSSRSCLFSRRKKLDNIVDLLNSPTSLERIAARTINSADNSLSTLGKRKSVGNPVEEVKKVLFQTENIIGMSQDLSLSNKATKVFCRNIRISTGSRKSIESHTREKIDAAYHQLDEFFEMRKLVYRVEDKETKEQRNIEQPTIVCSNLTGLIDEILSKRKRVDGESILVKISIDGGGGFLKMCLSVFDIHDPLPKANNAMSKKFLESGVKKVFVVGIVPDISENYINMKRLWLNSSVDKLQKYTIATDLKLCNILLGMMSHSSCHPCPWCNITKENLHKKGVARTISSLMSLFWEFFDSRKETKDAKTFGNVIHPPILSDDDANDTPVLNILPPPELHLMIGVVNKMYAEMEKVWLESEQWLHSCNVKKEAYHGGTFAGNESRKLLKNVNRLEGLSPPSQCENYVVAFKSFNEVVASCYGKELRPDFLDKIRIFTRDYMRLGISVTPKVHAVMYHVGEFCALTGMGLAPWSEQTGESVHHDFNETWKKFKVNNVERPIYASQLLKAVCMYNSQHI